MKIVSLVLLLFISFGCRKTKQDIAVSPGTALSDNFTKFTIRKGQQFCDQSTYKPVEISEMKFNVRFDSSSIYQSVAPENQFDINKLYGFADNGMDHHQYSARIGWRWSEQALRLFAYVYNNGKVSSKELSVIAIGETVHCAIRISGFQYIFTVNDITEPLSRGSTSEKGKGYQLFPYFGGNEAAPHDINIWISEK